MIDAIQYRDIADSVNKKLYSAPRRVVVFDGVSSASSQAMSEINSKIKSRCLVAVLFCNPHTNFCQNEILGSLSYLHHRSKEHIDIFCCGYGAYWPENKYPDLQMVTKIDGVDWSYSDNSFVSAVEAFEARTEWQYSGENELLLLDVTPSDNFEELNIHNALVCNLEKMKKDEAFSSVRSLMESIIRYAASNDSADAWSFSDKKGGDVAQSFLKEALLSVLPNSLRDAYRQAESYAVRQI